VLVIFIVLKCFLVIVHIELEESGLYYPVMLKSSRYRRNDISGFTLIEVLIALAVMGVATTLFISMYTASLSLSRASTHYEVASQIAEEYMVELQVNPQRFAWPNFDGEVNTFQAISLEDNSPLLRVAPPTAMPIPKKAYDRETNLYSEFMWHAKAKIYAEDSNFVEVQVTVTWPSGSKRQYFYLTSTVPRSVGEGIGL
jgi:prepilin-type N-terminal cleavage/methylation domain-containing protein